MKKILLVTALAAAMLTLTGCGTGFPNGLVYTQLNMPVVVNNLKDVDEGMLAHDEVVGYKVLGVVVWGDTSYKTLMEKAKLDEVQRVEYFSYDICGCGYFGFRAYGLKKAWRDDNK